MTLRALWNRGLAALGVRGHGLVTKSISGIEKTVAKLEQGVQQIAVDLEHLGAEIKEKRAKYNQEQLVRYQRQDALVSAQDRAKRVAGRYAEFIK